MATFQEKKKYLRNWWSFTPPIRNLLNSHKVEARFRDGTRMVVRGTKKSDFFAMTTVMFENVYQVEKMKDPKLILDIGANIGAFTILAAKRFPNAKVIAVEPAPSNFKQLQENVHRNGLTNIELRQCAVGKEYGQAILFLDEKRDSAHSLLKDLGHGGREKSVSVPLVPLSEFGKVDAMKIDCEGSELEILNNATPDCQYLAIEFDIGKKELWQQFIVAGYSTDQILESSSSDIAVFTK